LPSASPPELFIDRSLGRHVVPDALRAAGVVVHVMADVYSERIGQGLADEEWLRDAGKRGWVVLMKDAKIRYRPAELRVVVDHGLRTFCLTNANLRGAEMAARFVANLPRIVRVAQEPGPYIFGVYADGLRRIWPKPSG
jgi:PIN like domain